MRMKLPGTSPPNVQNKYSTPSASLRTTSRTSSLTMTLVAWLRRIGGGTRGAWVSTATSSPTMLGSAPLAAGPFDGAAASFAWTYNDVAAIRPARQLITFVEIAHLKL